MRLIAWNIRAGGGRRVEQIARQIERWQPDLITLSEFRATPPSQSLARQLADLGLTHQLSAVNPDKPATNGLLLASRFPLRQLHLPQAPLEPHRWLLAQVLTAQPFGFGAMHIPNFVTGRKAGYHQAVLALVESWSNGPALLMGDTNSGLPDLDEETRVFTALEAGWIRALAAFGWGDAFRRLKGDERIFTWYSPNGGNGFRLDQAFVNRELIGRVTDVWYEWGTIVGEIHRRDVLSDHAAILLDLDADDYTANGHKLSF
jgi:exonuclease III